MDETKYKKREGTVVKVKISNPNQTVNIDKTKQTKKRTAMVQNEKKNPIINALILERPSLPKGEEC